MKMCIGILVTGGVIGWGAWLHTTNANWIALAWMLVAVLMAWALIVTLWAVNGQIDAYEDSLAHQRELLERERTARAKLRNTLGKALRELREAQQARLETETRCRAAESVGVPCMKEGGEG